MPPSASAVVPEGLTAVLRLRRAGTLPGVGKGRDDFIAALELVGLKDQNVACTGLTPMSRLPKDWLTLSAEDKTSTPVHTTSGFAPSTDLS